MEVALVSRFRFCAEITYLVIETLYQTKIIVQNKTQITENTTDLTVELDSSIFV